MSRHRYLLRALTTAAVVAALITVPRMALALDEDLPPAPPHPVAGVVLDAVGQPIPGATIESLTDGNSATSDESGAYRVELTEGTHVVSVNAWGFEQKRVELRVPLDEPGGVDFVLETAARHEVSGTVTDGAAHGWPLYAKVTVVGAPAPFFTDPVTGEYSGTVFAGRHTVVVQSLYTGYQYTVTEVEIDGDTDLDAALDLHRDCVAPGYVVDGADCVAVDGALLVGHVLADAEDDVLDDATIEDLGTGALAVTGPTPDDDALRDGFYHVFAEGAGAHDYEVRHEGFVTIHDTVDVESGAVVYHDFDMG